MLILKKHQKLILFSVLLFSICLSNAQVGINTNTPHASAILDVTATDKGMLFPNVALTSNTDVATITGTPANGLVIYNTGTGGLNYTGLVIWNGSEWKSLSNKSTITGTIATLDCTNATLSEAGYTTSTPYLGTLTIPYTGGNGGTYTGQTIGPVNGLTATLTAGNFDVGTSNLTLRVSGTPTVSSPTTTSFTITIDAKTCTVVVGDKTSNFIEEYAQVAFESFGGDGTLATLLPGSKNVSRVKRISNSVFRIDFINPFQDTSYIVSGFGSKDQQGVSTYLYSPTHVPAGATTLQIRSAVENDPDMDPGNTLGLDPRETTVKTDGVTYNRAKYRTHFYIVEGRALGTLQGASLSATR